MNGWGSPLGGGWDDEPAWLYEITWEWEPLPGQRYPGDPGRRRRAVHVPVHEASALPGPPDRPATEAPHRSGEDTVPLSRRPYAAGPPPVPRVDPSWNRPAPVPERLPDSRAPRRADAPAPPPEQRRPPEPRGRAYYGTPAAPPPARPEPPHGQARPVSSFEQTRPIPQDIRPRFRDAPPAVQDMPAPFHGAAQPTLRDARPRSESAAPPLPASPARDAPGTYGSARPASSPDAPTGPRPPRRGAPEGRSPLDDRGAEGPRGDLPPQRISDVAPQRVAGGARSGAPVPAQYRSVAPVSPSGSAPARQEPRVSPPAQQGPGMSPPSQQGPGMSPPARQGSGMSPPARHGSGVSPWEAPRADPAATLVGSVETVAARLMPVVTPPESVVARQEPTVPIDPAVVFDPLTSRFGALAEAGVAPWEAPRSGQPVVDEWSGPGQESFESVSASAAVEVERTEPISAPPAVDDEPVQPVSAAPDTAQADWSVSARPAAAVPVSPSTGGAPSEAVDVDPGTGEGDSGDDDRHGLGWLLKQHGLGAVTVVSDAEPADADDSPQGSVPEPGTEEATETAARPVSGAAVKQHWFAPFTDAHADGGDADGAPDAVDEAQDGIGEPSGGQGEGRETADHAGAERDRIQDHHAEGDADEGSAADYSGEGSAGEGSTAASYSSERDAGEGSGTAGDAGEGDSGERGGVDGQGAPEARSADGHVMGLREVPAAEGWEAGERHEPAPHSEVAEAPETSATEPETVASGPVAGHRWVADPEPAAPADVDSVATEPAMVQPAGRELVETATAGAEPVETGAAEVEPTRTDSAEAGPAGTASAEARPADSEPAEPEPAGATPNEAEPAEATLAKAESAGATPEAKPAQTTLADTGSAEVGPAETGPADSEREIVEAAKAAPAESRPAENGPTGSGSAESGPAENGPAEVGTAAVAGSLPAALPEPPTPPVVAAAPASPAPVFARQQGHYGDRAPRRLVDPEQVLASYPWRISPDTLREVIDEPEELLAVRDRLTDKLEYAERDAVRARLLSLRAVVSRVLGDLDFALADGRAALAHAETTGELRRTSIVRARLAHVLRWRGEFAEADQLFEEANSVELPDRLRAEMYELAGRSAFDQGRLLEAVNRFEQALDLRRSDDDQMVSRIELALDTVARAAREAGWGPYPRGIDEILQRPSRSETWPGGSYTQARPFSDGLAWVSRDADGGWFAVDGQDRVIVPGGFDDVGPFRRGVAPVRRGAGWGAIDRHGRIVVQPKYRRFVTALVGGRRVDGFTEEGLAVVDAGDRLGVVDRGGQLVVAPVHAALVIHPVAYLIGDRAGRWGALDRNGDPLIEARHRSEAEVVHEIDRLLSDTRPVL